MPVCASFYLHHQEILVLPYLDNWLVHHPDRQVLLYHHSQLPETQRMEGFKINVACTYKLSSQSVLSFQQVSQFMGSLKVSGLIPTGLSTAETITTTLSFCGSDKLVYTTMSIRVVGPWPPASAVTGPIFPYLTISYIYEFLYPCLGRPYGDSQTSGSWVPSPQAPYQLFRIQGSNVSSAPLGSRDPGRHDCYGQHYGSVLYQQAGRNSFPFPATSSSGTILMTSVPGHSYQGHTHSGLSRCDSSPLVSAKSTNNYRMESPS